MRARIGLDTIKFRIDGEDLGLFCPWTKSEGIEYRRQTGEMVQYEVWDLRKAGGAYVKQETTTGQTTVEFSAKVLDDQYFEGISTDTWDRVASRISDLHGLNLHLPDRYHCSRSDYTVNADVEDTYPYLFALKHGLSWDRKRADGRFSDSAIFWNSSERITFYDKLREMPDLASMTESKILRMEYQPKRTQRVRKKLCSGAYYIQSSNTPQLEKIYLADHLQKGKQKVVFLDVWKSFRKVDFEILGIAIDDIMKFSGKKLAQIRKILGDRYILENCGNDQALVRGLLNAHFPQQTASRNFLQMKRSWQYELKQGKKISDIIDEVGEMIEKAS